MAHHALTNRDILSEILSFIYCTDSHSFRLVNKAFRDAECLFFNPLEGKIIQFCLSDSLGSISPLGKEKLLLRILYSLVWFDERESQRKLDTLLYPQVVASAYILSHDLCTLKVPFNRSEQLYSMSIALFQEMASHLLVTFTACSPSDLLKCFTIYNEKAERVEISMAYLDRYHVRYYQLPTMHEASLAAFAQVFSLSTQYDDELLRLSGTPYAPEELQSFVKQMAKYLPKSAAQFVVEEEEVIVGEGGGTGIALLPVLVAGEEISGEIANASTTASSSSASSSSSSSSANTFLPAVAHYNIASFMFLDDGDGPPFSVPATHPLASKANVLRDLRSMRIPDLNGTLPQHQRLCTVVLPNCPNIDDAAAFAMYHDHPDHPYTDIPKPITTNIMEDMVCPYDAAFVDRETELFKLILAANVLDFRELLDLSCAKTAARIKGKTPNEIRAIFGISE